MTLKYTIKQLDGTHKKEEMQAKDIVQMWNNNRSKYVAKVATASETAKGTEAELVIT